MKGRTFRGGYRFNNFIGQPSYSLEVLDVPPKVIVPLTSGFGNSLLSQVKVGEDVYAGQIIASDESQVSSPIHATINGKVTAIEKRNYFKREIQMVEILGDDSSKITKLDGYLREWEKLGIEKLEELIYKSGTASLDKQGIPTRFNSSIISNEEVETLIIHGIGSEAYNLSLELMLKDKNIFNFVEGIKILKKIMPNAKVYLAINKERKEILERLEKLTINLKDFELFALPPKYPQGYDEVLVPTLTGKKFPYGYSAANIGIVILGIQSVLHVFEAVCEGKPLIERTIALCGPSFKKPIHVKVRIGTPLQDILSGRLINEDDVRVVFGSLLTGSNLNDFSLPVDRTVSQIIAIPENKAREFISFFRSGLKDDSYSRAFLSSYLLAKKRPTTNQYGEERPCIQCGYCIEICPVDILPTFIDRHSKLSTNQNLMRYGVFNCIDCNLCSYVCPSKIPLAKNIKDAKAKLVDSGCDHSLCVLPKFDLIGLQEYKGVKTVK